MGMYSKKVLNLYKVFGKLLMLAILKLKFTLLLLFHLESISIEDHLGGMENFCCEKCG